jgi:CHAT domain-containing protein
MPRDTRNKSPQYLTTARISTLHVPGALVVMTGCATGTGDARSGAGLLGLTRAWLMAGASGVLSTAWPVEDSTGEIFSRFYQYYPVASAAEALRRSQVEILHRTAPSQWASYQLTGGLR